MQVVQRDILPSEVSQPEAKNALSTSRPRQCLGGIVSSKGRVSLIPSRVVAALFFFLLSPLYVYTHLSLSFSLIFHGPASIVPRDNRHLTQCQLLPGWRYIARRSNETTRVLLLLLPPLLLPLPSLFRRSDATSPRLRRALGFATAPLCNDSAHVHSSLVPNDTSTQRENVSSHSCARCNAESPFSHARIRRTKTCTCTSS